MTSLHVAAKTGKGLEILRFLIDRAADINIQDDNGVSETVQLIQQSALKSFEVDDSHTIVFFPGGWLSVDIGHTHEHIM